MQEIRHKHFAHKTQLVALMLEQFDRFDKWESNSYLIGNPPGSQHKQRKGPQISSQVLIPNTFRLSMPKQIQNSRLGCNFGFLDTWSSPGLNTPF